MNKLHFPATRWAKALAGAFAFAVLLSGCQMVQELLDKPGKPRENKTILQIAANDRNFTALAAAVLKTGLDPVLNGTTQLTVFAPNNEAFSKLPAPFNSAQSIARISDAGQIETLRTILLYHVLAGEVKAADVKPGPAQTQKPAPNNTIYLSKNGKKIFVNGNTNVIRADIDATNGVIHAIDMVLMFPTQNIVQIASGNPAFSALVAAVVKTGLAGTLGGNGDFTVFAPTNDAFSKLPHPFNNAANINAITDAKQIDFLRNVLRYHVIAPARVFSTTN